MKMDGSLIGDDLPLQMMRKFNKTILLFALFLYIYITLCPRCVDLFNFLC